MKKKWLILTITFTMLVAACASQPVPTTTPVVNEVELLQPTVELATPESISPAETENVDPESQNELDQNMGMADYKIVSGESTLTYEVGEVFINQDNRFATAIGVTSDITGIISLDEVNPQNTSIGSIVVDISLFKSGSVKRDNTIRSRFLESSKFPQVIFNASEIMGLPENYQLGETITFQVVGETTIRETTLPLTFDVSANFDGTTLSGQAETTFLMSDYGFGPISIAGILNTEDEVKIIINLIARR